MKKLLLVFTIALLIFAVLIVYHKRNSSSSLVLRVSPTPSVSSTIPQGTMIPETFTQISWKRYTSTMLGVSFAYPPSFKLSTEMAPQQSPYMKQPTIFEVPQQNLVQILYAYGYLFRITKVTTTQSLKDWVSQNVSNPKYHYTNEYQTTFNGFPAVLSLETTDTVKSTQVPESIYYVQIGKDTIYQIEYAIPLPTTISYPTNYPMEMKAENERGIAEENQLEEYIPQILGSVKFL